MGRIVIPRPRLERRGYQPKYRRQQTLDRRHKFGPDDIKLLMKVLDTAVAVGGKVAGAVGRTQDGPDAARARQLVADRKAREQGGVSPSSTAEAAVQLASPGTSPQADAFIAQQTPAAQPPAVAEPSPRGDVPVIATVPGALAERRQRADVAHVAGFNEGTAIREGMEHARQEALRARQRGPVVGGPPMFAPVPRGAADQTARHVPPPQQAAADPPTPAARPAQVEVLVDQAVMMPPGQVHAPLANDSLMTAQALVAAAQANREAMWPSVAELQRMDVGALQALGAYADTPQKRAQIMQAIRDSPDVQPTSVSDLLGMGEDHVRRAQKKALAVMKGSSKGGGLGLKDTVALAKSMYGMRIDEGNARRASELHPGKLTLQQQDIEAGRRKALLEDRTRDAVVRQKLAAARKAEAEATKRERGAERALKRAKSRGGATYKRGVEDKAVEDRVNAKLRIEALKAEGKTPPPKLVAAAGPLADASNAEVFRYYDTHFQGRKGAANRSVKLGRAFSHLPKPPRTPSEGSVPWGARKELLRLDRVYTFYETALLNKDSQAAKDITAELGRPPTQVDLADIRNERAELSAEIDKLRQRGRSPAPAEQPPKYTPGTVQNPIKL